MANRKPNWGLGAGMFLRSLGQSMQAAEEQKRREQMLVDERARQDAQWTERFDAQQSAIAERERRRDEASRAEFELRNPVIVPRSGIGAVPGTGGQPLVPNPVGVDLRRQDIGSAGLARLMAGLPLADQPQPAPADPMDEILPVGHTENMTEAPITRRRAMELSADLYYDKKRVRTEPGAAQTKQGDIDRAVLLASGPTSAAGSWTPGYGIDQVAAGLYGPNFITDYRGALKQAIAGGAIDINDIEAQQALARSMAAGMTPDLSRFGDADPRSIESAYDPGSDVFYDPSLKNTRRFRPDTWDAIPGTATSKMPNGVQYAPVPRDQFIRSRILPALERGWMSQQQLLEIMKRYGVDENTVSEWVKASSGAAATVEPEDEEAILNDLRSFEEAILNDLRSFY